MGRIKEISRKSAHTRKRNPVVYLICEGSETEIRYFKRFRSRGCNIDIIPISSQYKSADRLVQKAKATMGNNPYYPEDGDSIWCVFDRDDNSNEVLLRAKQSAPKGGLPSGLLQSILRTMALVTLYKSAGRGRRLPGTDSLAETAKENPRL